MATGPLTINAGNTTISSAITSTSSNALVFNANSTLTIPTPTTNVNAAITNGGSITINTGTFNVAQNITTTSTGAITISAANQISSSTDTRRTISTQGGNITLNADNDANGSGWIDIDDLTINAGAGNLIVRGETFNVNGTQSRKTYINGTGSFTFESSDVSFGQNIETAWFVIDQDANGISGLNFGKSGNAFNAYLNSTFTIAGPINVYGSYVEVSGAVTSSGNADILLKGIVNSGSCVNVFGGITKSSGTGTLLMQGHGRVINSGTISATGTGVLNLVMWSDYDGDNVGGGSTLNGGSVSTNGGHVWIGGSNSNGGSYTWNGLTVGDGPSIGTSVSNCNALDLYAPITTNGGDVLLWASSPGCGSSSIASDGTRLINAGSGDITFIAPNTTGAIELTSTGVISLLPHAGSYAAALTLGGTLTSGHFTFSSTQYSGLKINSLANSGLVIGNYAGHSSGSTAVTQGNSSNVTVSSALSTKSLEIHGGAIALNENITTLGTGSDVLIKGTSNINLAASKTITTAAGDVNLWADSDDNSTGYVQLLAGAAINSTGGDINLGGGADVTSDYAFGTTAETCPEVVGTQYISGVHFRQSSSLNSNGGNISVRGQNANTSASAMSFGISLRGVTMNSGTGKIALNGIATGSGSVNAQGIASWGTLTLRSANTSADAISITGDALSSVGGSSLGINVVALFEATGIGGGITLTGKSGVASVNAGVNIGGDILAASGPITISGENISGVVDNIMIGSTTTIGKKSGTNVTSSSSNVILEGNRINIPGSVSIDCIGTVTVQPFGNSFASALSWPMTNLTIANTITGLTLGKSTNSADITFNSNTAIAGPISAYGGIITLNANLTTTNNGAISLYSDIALGGLSTARTLTAAGAFKYIPRTTTFSADVTYPITNLTATSTGLTIGKTTNDKNITINADVTGGAGIELYGNNVNINANLKTTSGGAMYLKGITTIAAGKYIESNGAFTHDGNLIFKSDATGTAAFGTLGGSFTTVSGTSTVERYIPTKRSWRLLTAAVKGASNNSIQTNWQGVSGEGLLLFSPSTYQSQTMLGYTTGGALPNIWKYNNGWQTMPDLPSENLFTNSGNNGFLVFVTGPSNSTNIASGHTETTLKPQGQLITGTVSKNLTANQYSLIANPYASAINTEALVTANTGSKVWMVDPSIGNFGGYVAYDGNWSVPTSGADKNIQSGQAFFAKTASNSTFTIAETNKIVGSSNTWFSRPADASSDKIRVLLYKDINATWQLADGILAVNSSSGNNEVDDTDTGKISNFNENILFRNGSSNLSIEYKGLPALESTQPMRLTGTTAVPYQLRVYAETYSNSDLLPYIEDTTTGITTAIPIDGSEVVIPFTGIAATSTNPDTRFRIIYQSNLSTANPNALAVATYPNPVNTGLFTIALKDNSTVAKYTLTNVLGQEVQSGDLSALNNPVDVKNLQEGIYLLKVVQEGKSFTTKLIIKK